MKIFLSIRTFLCRSRFVLLSLYLDPIQVSVMGFGTVSLSSSLPKCVAFRLLLRFHGLSELLCLSCSFLVSAPLTYCSKKNTESIYKNRLAVDLPEFKGKHRKFRNLVSSYLGKCSVQKNSSVMKFSFSSSFPHFFKNLIKKYIYIISFSFGVYV